MVRSCEIYDLITACTLTEDEERELQLYTEARGAVFFSTPFSVAAVERLERLEVPLYKLASGASNEIIEAVMATGKPVIASTGMESLYDAEKRLGPYFWDRQDVAVLHTTNLYPTPFNLARLRSIRLLKSSFPNAIVGYSDHSTTNHACFAAVAMGAEIIERHLAHPSVKGPDYMASIKGVADLKDLVDGVENIKQARGGYKTYLEEEDITRKFALYTDGKRH
jgi:N-acetylneuraminate synthase